jgi:SAM-dependent methyltransferase
LFRRIREKVLGSERRVPVLKSSGRCPTCLQDVDFIALEPYLRDSFQCSNCGSIPRERALMSVIEAFFPEWRKLVIHESSPSSRGASKRLRSECEHYIASQFFPGTEPGSAVPMYEEAGKKWGEQQYVSSDIRCENLEALTFADESIDLHISQDVMEHIFHPPQAFREIARTLKPGGAHIFTAPLWKKHEPSVVRARLEADGSISHLDTPVYHGNPLTEEGSLVTVDWGYDICRHIFEACGLFSHLVCLDDLSRGIRADLIEVVVTIKPR